MSPLYINIIIIIVGCSGYVDKSHIWLIYLIIIAFYPHFIPIEGLFF